MVPAQKRVPRNAAATGRWTKSKKTHEGFGKSRQVKITLTKGKRTSIRFGAVTISAKKLDAKDVKTNVMAGQAALERVAKKLSRPGVTLRVKKDVPLFFADENQPDILVRRLNGRVERGTFKNGQFEVVV
jgi:hypothetical protein